MAAAEFTGQAALVTGGASGIGLATARLLRGPRRAGRGAGPGPASGRSGRGRRCWSRHRRRHRRRRGTAGGRAPPPARSAAWTSWSTTPASARSARSRTTPTTSGGGSSTSTCSASSAASRAALPHLRRAAQQRGQAAIVNTCSIAAMAGLPQRALYSATKGAVYSLTLAMAADHVADRIRVNCVAPGTADTPWIARLLDAARRPSRRARGAGRPPADGPAGLGGRGGRGHRLPGQPAGGRGHRARRWPWTAACPGLRSAPRRSVANPYRSDDSERSELRFWPRSRSKTCG